MLFGLIFRPLAQVVGWVAWVFLTYTIEMVRLTARVPLASVPVKMEGWMVFAYYALLAGLTWWAKQTRERRRELWTRSNASVSKPWLYKTLSERKPSPKARCVVGPSKR